MIWANKYCPNIWANYKCIMENHFYISEKKYCNHLEYFAVDVITYVYSWPLNVFRWRDTRQLEQAPKSI